MRSITAALLLLSLAAGARLRPSAPRGGACRHASKDSGLLVARIREIVTEDPVNPAPHEGRVADSLPLLSPSAVRLIVADTATCRRVIAVVNANNAVLISQGKLHLSDSAYVLSAGPVFVMQDPDQQIGEWTSTYVVDSAITRVKAIMGF